MAKTKKALIAVLMVLIVGLFGMAFAACGSPIVSLDVKGLKTSYEYNQELAAESTGLVVTGTKEDGEKQELKADEYTIEPALGTKLTKDTDVVVTLKSDTNVKKTVKVKVNIKVTEITVKTEPTVKYYAAGEKFNPAGMVLDATYEDGSHRDITVEATMVSQEGLQTTDKSVTVTFGGQTVTQSVAVSTDFTIKTAPTKTVYMQGEKFNPAGMQLEVTYNNGDVRTVDVVGSSATYQTTILKAGDENVKITYGGKEQTQVIEFAKGVFIEAEDGLLNGVAVPGANRFTDARYTDDTANAETDLGATGTAAKAGSIANDGEHDQYLANGKVYLGDVKSGNTVTFVFNSDKAGTGNIAFRMASQYLKEDSSWAPIWMGDCQFNKICEFSVNGVKYDISDSAILPGGGSKGGEVDTYLWLNWKEVEFTNITFKAGRNDIELKFIPHDYTDCSQSGYNGKFTANVDSLIVTSATCEVTPCELIFDDYAYKANEINLVKEGEEIYFVLDGEFTKEDAWSGYKPEELAKLFYFDFQNNQGWARNNLANDRTLTLNGTSFTLKIRVTDLAVTSGAHLAHFGWQPDKAGQTVSNETVLDFKVGETVRYPETAIELEAAYKKFTFAPLGDGDGEWGCIAIRVATTAWIDSYTATSAELIKETVEGKDVPYLVIKGVANWTGYSAEDVAEYFANAISYDFQNVKAGSKVNNHAKTATVANVTAGTEANTFTGEYTLKIDLSTLATNANHAIHFADWSTKNEAGDKTIDGKDFGTLSNFDWLAADKVTGEPVVIGHDTYTIKYEPNYSTRNNSAIAGNDHADERKEHNYGCVAIVKVNDQKFENKVAKLVAEGDKVYLVVESTYENYTVEDVKALAESQFKDMQIFNVWTAGTASVAKSEVADGKVSLYIDVTELTTHENGYMTHFLNPTADLKLAVSENAAETSVTVGGKKYTVSVKQASDWSNGLTIVKVEEVAA